MRTGRLLASQGGYTYILALTIVMIMGIMLGLTGRSWKMLTQREREKELLFRGTQIKEAIENWYNPRYTFPGVPRARVMPLNDLKDLLQDPNSLTKIKYLPQSYGAELDDKNPRCAPDCAKLKVYEDPMTGKEWTIIRKTAATVGSATALPSIPQGAIIGVASKSDAKPFKTDFRDTSLATLYVPPAVATINSGISASGTSAAQNTGAITNPQANQDPRYSDWQFVATETDHSKLYRSYHETW